MTLYKSDKIRFISGLVLIIIIYSIHAIFMREDPNFESISKIKVHFIRFAITMIVYFVGTMHLGKLKDNWMSSIWHLVHISGLCIMASLGLYNWLINKLSTDFVLFANSIQEILISPVLYFAMGLLNKTLNKSSVK